MGNEFNPQGPIEEWDVAGFGNSSGDIWYVDPDDKYASETEHEVREFQPELMQEDWFDEVVVRITDENGHEHYYSLHGPWDDYDEFIGEIEDLWADYGGEAA